MTASAARVRTQSIGDRLATLIKAGISGLAVAQVGIVERLAEQKDYAQILPAVLIKPEEATYEATAEAGTGFQVADRFRLCYAEKLGATDDPMAAMITGASSVMAALAVDATLGSLRATIGPDQVIESRPEGIEWFPPESLFLAEMQAPVRVVVVRWLVLWRNQGA